MAASWYRPRALFQKLIVLEYEPLSGNNPEQTGSCLANYTGCGKSVTVLKNPLCMLSVTWHSHNNAVCGVGKWQGSPIMCRCGDLVTVWHIAHEVSAFSLSAWDGDVGCVSKKEERGAGRGEVTPHLVYLYVRWLSSVVGWAWRFEAIVYARPVPHPLGRSPKWRPHLLSTDQQ